MSASAASFDFTSLPSQFAHLLIVVYGRGDTVAVNTTILCRFNNDTAANYDTERGYNVGTTTNTPQETLADTAAHIGSIPAASAPAGLAGMSRVDIAGYAATTFQKAVVSAGAYKTATTTGSLVADQYASFWRSTAAINRVTILPVAGNFIAGSRCTVYGLA